VTDKQEPALHVPSCDRALRDLEALERLRKHPGRASLVLLLMSAADGELPTEDGEDEEAEKACASELIALLEPEEVECG
jgi:hypothetical protein